MSLPRHTVLIASYLEPQHVERIRGLDARLSVLYEPDLLPRPRYPADHTGAPRERTAEEEERWLDLLAEADILFDFDRSHLEDLPDLAPRIRWVQATSAGIGQLVRRSRLAERMPGTVFTTASGVHARPLAEFCLMGILMLRKGALRALEGQRRKRWERYAGTDLERRTLVIVGLGAVGTEVARVAKAFGMRVVGVKGKVAGIDPASVHADELLPAERLHQALEEAEHLVLIAPHTPDTEGLIGARELALLPPGAIVVNIGRGALIHEPALVEALNSGRLGGAVLDVFAEEPLPVGSPLWEMSNVIVSPHSGSTSDRENRRLTDLFCENLRRFLDGRPLLNVLDPDRMY